MGQALIILAAGMGTRMKSDLPKVLHPLGGAPMLHHAMSTANVLNPERVVVLVGPDREDVAKAARDFNPDAEIAVQKDRLGTGHAVLQAKDALAGHDGDAFVLFGDTPFIRADTLERMAAARAKADLVILGFEPQDPARYGRLVMDGAQLKRIVEFKDASDAERAITLCNGGLVSARADVLFDLLGEVGNDNASGEFYLTDIVEIANGRGLTVTAVTCGEAETLGINSRADLARAEAIFQARMRAEAMDLGVTLTDPETVFFALDTVVGRDVVVEPNVVFGPGVTVESGAQIRAFSHLEGCHVGARAIVGPYARLRPGTELGNDAKIGNFVEIKAAEIGEGAKVNHLSYIGDASIGEATNVGAGTVTCNYDGVMKHRTEIGAETFIGTGTYLVAPVKVGDQAMTASGSVITEDVPDGALAVARGKQVNKPGLARRLMEKLKAQKAKLKKVG